MQRCVDIVIHDFNNEGSGAFEYCNRNVWLGKLAHVILLVLCMIGMFLLVVL